MILTWKSKKAGKRVLPLITYAQSQLVVNGKQKRHFKTNKINLPIIHAKKGENKVILSFKAPIWFWFLLWIAILSWVGVIGFTGYKGIKHLKNKN